jgi:hypothetical protein
MQEDTMRPDRTRVAETVLAIEPWDQEESEHIEAVADWIAGGAPLYRMGTNLPC